jgi:hypothetical protein
MNKLITIYAVAAMCTAFIATSNVAQAEYYAGDAGDTGTLTVNAPNSLDGSAAEMWGFYHSTPSGAWKSATYGSGTVTNGTATINYTVPADFYDTYEAAIFSWEVEVEYSPTRQERTSYDTEGADSNWGQFLTRDPNGLSVTIDTFMQDQTRVTQTGASFRDSAQSATVFPSSSWEWLVEAKRPWTGTMAEYPDVYGGNTVDGDFGKLGLYPTYAADHGFSIEELETDNNWTKLRLYNDDGYSVELFGSKTATSEDAFGYMYWTTLIPDETLGSLSYDDATGVVSGTFGTALQDDVMYFLDVSGYTYLEGTDVDYQWLSGMGGTDLLMSGATVPEPATMSLLAIGGIALLRRKRRN